ncbi:hypothetical protein GCM10017687_84020 [Streptomyces echinatus]
MSLFAVTDGESVVPLQPAQDFKRALDGDEGPEHRRHGRVLAAAVGRPKWSTRSPDRAAADGGRSTAPPHGTPFPGCSTPVSRSPRAVESVVIEFNARFGDPETQVVLAR